jgi:hypothetical protein
MTYIMPLFASILSFLGVDSKKSVHFEDAVKDDELTDGPITASAAVNESA